MTRRSRRTLPSRFAPILPSRASAAEPVLSDTTNLFWWADAADSDNVFIDDGVTNCTNGDLCKRWTDRAGVAPNGYAENNNSARRPTWRSSGMNGRGYLEFRQTSGPSGKSITIVDSKDWSPGCTVFAAIRFISALRPNDYQSIFSGPGNGDFEWQKIRSNHSTDADELAIIDQGIAEIASSTNPVTIGQIHTLAIRYNDNTGAWKFWKDGTADGSGTNAVAVDSNPNTIIGQWAGTAQWISADIGELLFYDTEKSDTEVSDIFTNYLNARWLP